MFSVLPLLAISAMLEPGAMAQLPSVSWVGWGGAVYAAFVSSLLGHGLYYVLVQRHPVAQVTPWLLLVPVLAIGAGHRVLGRPPGPAAVLGGAMVLGGVLLIALRALRKARHGAAGGRPVARLERLTPCICDVSAGHARPPRAARTCRARGRNGRGA